MHDALERRFRQAELAAERRGVGRRELRDLSLDLHARGRDRGAPVRRERRPDTRDGLGRASEIRLVQVHDDELRLLAEEAVTAERVPLLRGELEVAHRRTRRERVVKPAQERGLALLRFAVRGSRRAELDLDALQAPLDHAEVGDEELQLERPRIARGIDVAVEMRYRRIAEGADDMHERVRRTELRELRRGDPFAGSRALRERDVRVPDLRMRRLARLEEGREPVDPLVGHLRDADVHRPLRAGERAGRGVPAGEQIEERRLADVGKADDRRFHRAS